MSEQARCGECVHPRWLYGIFGECDMKDQRYRQISKVSEVCSAFKPLPAPAAGPWQPGSTAPKDGSLILCKWDVGVGVARWVRFAAVEFRSGHWELATGEWVVYREPSLWAPINLPEEASNASSG